MLILFCEIIFFFLFIEFSAEFQIRKIIRSKSRKACEIIFLVVTRLSRQNFRFVVNREKVSETIFLYWNLGFYAEF